MNTRLKAHTNLTTKKPKIKTILTERGISQSDLAKLLKVTESFISQLLKGVRRSMKNQERISVLLGVPYEELWDDTAGDNCHDEEDTTTLD